MRLFAIVVLSLSLAITSFTAAGISPVLNYQGSLTDSLGVPYPDGIHTITFSIYADLVVETPLWTETQSLEVKNGLVHAYLGIVDSFPTVMFESSPLYLGIRFESQPEFTPRHLLAASVYSFLARNSQMLEGQPASHFAASSEPAAAVGEHDADSTAHANLNVDASQIASGVIDPDRLPPITFDSTNISDGGIATGDLADSAIIGDKIAAGAVHNEHLATSAFTGDNIADGSLGGVDLADSTLTGDKIASGAISSEHLSVSAFTGANIEDGSVTAADLADSTIVGSKIAAGEIKTAHLTTNVVNGSHVIDESLTGADIDNGTVTAEDLGYGAVTTYHIADATIMNNDIAPGTITGVTIQDGSISNSDLGVSSVGTYQVADNSVTTEDIMDGSLKAIDIHDEPGLDYTSSTLMASVGPTIVNWMSLTISAPEPGYIIAFFNCIANIANNEVAQASISTSPSTFGAYGEARISSSATSTGANMTITISEVIPVAEAGEVNIYANVRAAASSSGPVDFYQGRLQAIYIRSGY